ncbi:MAG: hypothetical protein DMF24_08990 [Verrucomicrobia bacterium]|nr:MAG: hypothetical protein DMF24_08990 [Verrucomicrobiota bacterium]
MSAQSRWIILMVKNETVAYPRDALLRQGYGAAGQPTARRHTASLSMTYGFLQKFLGWGILPRKWPLTFFGVFRQTASNAKIDCRFLILT